MPRPPDPVEDGFAELVGGDAGMGDRHDLLDALAGVRHRPTVAGQQSIERLPYLQVRILRGHRLARSSAKANWK
jgi:hypothetical protein